MHELTIALSLVEAVCGELPALGDVRIVALQVRIGPLSPIMTGRELELTAVEVVAPPS